MTLRLRQRGGKDFENLMLQPAMFPADKFKTEDIERKTNITARQLRKIVRKVNRQTKK